MSSRNTEGGAPLSPSLPGQTATGGKLVRDLVPEIIRREGKEPHIYVADEDEYGTRLRSKLQEEVAEFLEAGHVADRVEELADILEVVHALGQHLGLTPVQLDAVRARKALAQGAFEQRIVWTGCT